MALALAHVGSRPVLTSTRAVPGGVAWPPLTLTCVVSGAAAWLALALSPVRQDDVWRDGCLLAKRAPTVHAKIQRWS